MSKFVDLFRTDEELLRKLVKERSVKDAKLHAAHIKQWTELMEQTKGKFLMEVMSLKVWKENPRAGTRLLAAIPAAIGKVHVDYLAHLKSELDQIILKQGKHPKLPR
jgi:hypothetical protein